VQIILAGGGSKTKSQPLDELFTKLVHQKPVLYIPIAMPPEKYTPEQCREWLLSIFKFEVVMWTDLKHKTIADMSTYGGIYVGGGNTYLLLHHLRNSGFLPVLLEAIKSHPYYGGSAGAVILGKSILTSTDTNSVELTEFAGLNLLHGYSIKCHYNNAHDDFLKQFTHQHGPVIAIPEESGALFNGTTIQVLGTAPIVIFNQHKTLHIAPGEAFSLITPQ
jgi:dipeptidase E